MTITNKQVKVITDVDFNNNKIKNAKINASENEITNVDHSQLANRNIADQHPISAITNLQSSLDAKANQATTYTKTETDTLLSAKANSADLATVATSGSYNDLENKPTIPSIAGLATEVYVHDTATAYVGAHNSSNVAHNDIRTSVSGITEMIPAQASSSNQLADKAFVNSSISTNTATFRGTSATGLTEQQFLAWANSLEKTNNDYVFWDTIDSSSNAIFKRYKYNGTNWVYEYTLNNSSFTASQWSSINSGITSSSVTQIGTNTSNIALKENTSNKSDSYTTSSSTTYTSTKALVDGLATKQNTITSSNKIDYSLISNTPTIPTVNNGTITITQGGVTKGTFTVNQSGNTTVALDGGTAWGNITGTLSNQTDLNTALNAKQTAPTVVTDSSSTSKSVALASNTIYKYGTLSSLTLSSYTASDLETVLYFNTDSAIQFTDNTNTITWVGSTTTPTLEASSQYVISICNGIGVIIKVQ